MHSGMKTVAILLLLTTLTPSHARAISLLVDSLEWLTDESETIGVYKVLTVSTNEARQTISLKLSEKIKGKPPENHDMHFAGRSKLRQIKADQEVLRDLRFRAEREIRGS